MKGSLVFAVVAAMVASAQGQVFRLGWQSHTPTTHNAESMNVVEVDAAGDLIFAGTIQFPGNQVDVVVRKLSPLGVLKWESRFDAGDGTATDFVQGAVVDAKGDVYLSLDYPTNGFGKMALAKVSGSDGKVLFKRIHDTGGDRTMATAMALDPMSGSIVQVGGFGSNARAEVFTLKWNPDGSVAWAQRWTNSIKGDRQAQGVSIGARGEVTVVGYTATASRQESLALRYGSDGSLKWTSAFAGSPGFGTDAAKFSMTEANGDVVIAGDEFVEGNRNYAYIAKLADGDGKVAWKNHLNDVRNNDGRPLGLARVVDGYLMGVQTYPLSANNVDLAVLKYDLSGKQQWKALVNGGPGYAEAGASFVVDAYGYSYISGASQDDRKDSKYLVACVDPLGAIAWKYRDTVGHNGSAPAGLVIANDSGHVVVSGNVSRGIDDDVNLLAMYQAPRANSDSYTVIQGETLKISPSFGVLSNDVFHRFATMEQASAPPKGLLTLESEGAFSFVAPADFVGTVSFSYRLKREGLQTSEAIVSINVINKPYFDSDSGKIDVVLTREWKEYSIDVSRQDLSRIKTGFVFTLGGSSLPTKLYLFMPQPSQG